MGEKKIKYAYLSESYKETMTPFLEVLLFQIKLLDILSCDSDVPYNVVLQISLISLANYSK